MGKTYSELVKATGEHAPTSNDLLRLACDFIESEGLTDKFLEFAEAATIVSSWDNIAEIEYRDNLHCVRLE